MIFKNDTSLTGNTGTVLRNYRLYLPQRHVGLLGFRDHHGLSIITQTSETLGKTFWVISSGPAKLMTKGKGRSNGLCRKESSTSCNPEANFSDEDCGLLY